MQGPVLHKNGYKLHMYLTCRNAYQKTIKSFLVSGFHWKFFLIFFPKPFQFYGLPDSATDRFNGQYDT